MFRRLEQIVRRVRTLPMLDYGVDRQGTPYIMTQYKEVESLAIAARKADAPIAFYLWQMALQIAKLHRSGIAFGDLSEDSFIVDSLHRVHLCGIPPLGASAPSEGANDPTLAYAAPEQGSPNADPLAQDVFAFGALTHLLLTRRAIPRFASKTQLQEYAKTQLPGLLTLYQNAPEWSQELLQATLSWNPAERPLMSDVVTVTGSDVPIGQRSALWLSNFRDVSWPQIKLGEVPEDSFHKVIIFSSFLLFFIVAGTYGVRGLKLLPHTESVDATQSFDKVTTDLTKITSLTSAGKDTAPAAIPKGSGFFQQLETTSPDYTIPPAPVSVTTAANAPETELERFASLEEHDMVGQSLMRAVPVNDLISLLRKGPEENRDRYTSAARELINRDQLKAAPRLAILALLHTDSRKIGEERRAALVNVVDESASLDEIGVLSRWGTEDAAVVLSALAARGRSAEIAAAAFLNLASRPHANPTTAALMNYIKQEQLSLTMGELRAFALLTLGNFATPGDIQLAIRKLEAKASALDLRLMLLGRHAPSEEAPWCANLIIVGSCFSRYD
ncbi:MAG: hypothetical protein U0136_12725 [Bdellovibrionota bacterium]